MHLTEEQWPSSSTQRARAKLLCHPVISFPLLQLQCLFSQMLKKTSPSHVLRGRTTKILLKKQPINITPTISATRSSLLTLLTPVNHKYSSTPSTPWTDTYTPIYGRFSLPMTIMCFWNLLRHEKDMHGPLCCLMFLMNGRSVTKLPKVFLEHVGAQCICERKSTISDASSQLTIHIPA